MPSPLPELREHLAALARDLDRRRHRLRIEACAVNDHVGVVRNAVLGRDRAGADLGDRLGHDFSVRPVKGLVIGIGHQKALATELVAGSELLALDRILDVALEILQAGALEQAPESLAR